MLEAIQTFFARRIVRSPAESATGPSDLQLAACALLLEIAHADGEFSPEEEQMLLAAMQRHYGLDEATAAELLELADAERTKAIDHFQFARLIATHYDLGQRMVLAEMMWGLILADGRIANREAALVRRLAGLLDLQPAYLAQAKQAAARPRAE
jgi:uncharacterized tellurite resistance protein B-like protein